MRASLKVAVFIVTWLLVALLAQVGEAQVCGGDSSHVIETPVGSQILMYLQVTDNVVLLFTYDGIVFRSVDGGATWNNETSKLQGLLEYPSPYFLRNYNAAWWMYQSHADPRVIYIMGNGGRLWVTTDAGETYTRYTASFEFEELIPHPHDPQLLMAVGWASCCNDELYFTCGNLCAFEAWLSTNQGQTWTKLRSALPNGALPEWGFAGSFGHTNRTILLCEWPFTGDPVLLRSDDFFATSTTLLTNTIDIYMDRHSKTILAAEYTGFGISLSVSTDGGATFRLSRFPQSSSDNLYVNALSILDASHGSTWVGVDFVDGVSDRVSLYVSDVFTADFTLSLSDVRRSSRGIDYERIRGLEGIYVANQHYSAASTFRTFWSYDVGATWTLLPAPANETCDGCHLHLFQTADTGGLADPTGRHSALGTVVALGQVGEAASSLTYRAQGAHLYLTQDAGHSWKRIHNGTWAFDLSTYGGLISIADPSQPSTNLKYSRDSGETWSECSFVADMETRNVSYTVYGLRSSVSHVSDAMLRQRRNYLWVETATLDHDTQRRGYSILWVNLSEPIPDCLDTDYELFDPQGASDNCVLGQRTRYTRKKPSSVCVADPTRLNHTVVETCNCTRDDYYCTFCFVADPVTKECIPDQSDYCRSLYDPSMPPTNCSMGSTYLGAPKYRRIAASKCINDIPTYLDPRVVPCPEQPIYAPSPVKINGNGPRIIRDNVPRPHKPVDTLPGDPMKSLLGSRYRSFGLVVLILGLLFVVFLISFLIWFVAKGRKQMRPRPDNQVMDEPLSYPDDPANERISHDSSEHEIIPLH